MVSLCPFVPASKKTTLSFNHVPPIGFPNFRGSLNFASLISFPQSNSGGCHVLGSNVKQRTTERKKISFLSYRGKQWENPDDGSDSEYEDDGDNEDESDKVEENDLDFESDWEGESAEQPSLSIVKDLSTDEFEEHLIREAEQLLSPEEREILRSNESAILEKISTRKWNAFHTFALTGQIKYMDRLFDKGVYVDVIDKDGRTALHHATISKREPVISHLLRKGANPQARDLDGATPLHYAVQASAIQTVKLLIKYNVDVNVADVEGWTPLHIAMQSRNRDIAKVLLVNGADITRKNKDGKTPLDLSLCYGKDYKSYDLAKLLKLVTASRAL